MLLIELKNYLQKNKRVTLTDIAYHFDTPPEVVSGMLEHWQRKGRVRLITANSTCQQGCCQCSPVNLDIYEWIESVSVIPIQEQN
ncbi:MAG: hypothetical protein BWK79_12315 [Beggiatoa sp. IS2]|nr:MAG: hypothetical protein BWK79_12315 [Beggiatoa sp. IS2]